MKTYCIAPKRLLKEFAGTIGWAPATTEVWGAAGAAAWAGGLSVTEGFSAGFFAACFVSPDLGSGLDFAAARRIGLAGAAGGGGALAVVSAPPRPTLRARLEKKPSEEPGAAEATWVDGWVAGAGAITGGADAIAA